MALTSAEYEAQANRLRSQMGGTADKLRSNLTPSNFASEAASRVGVSELSWRGALDSRARAIQARLPSPGLASLCGFWRRLASATERVSTR